MSAEAEACFLLNIQRAPNCRAEILEMVATLGEDHERAMASYMQLAALCDDTGDLPKSAQ